jgi:putative oxidoreductase
VFARNRAAAAARRPSIDRGFRFADAAARHSKEPAPSGPPRRLGRRASGRIDEALMTDIAARPAPAASRSLIASFVGGLVALCAIVPYAVVALGLRLVMARVFFLAGQDKIEGLLLRIHVDFGNIGDIWMTLPTQVKATTLQMFASKYSALPIPTHVAAYLFSYAEFLLPVCLAIGFATRISALLLLIMTVLMAVYATPETFWTAQVYWVSILMVLMTVGPGGLSVDGLIRYLATRDDKAPEYR